MDDLVERSKYYLRENANGTFTLMRFDEPKGAPNNAELEFWLRARDAEARCKRMEPVVEAARDMDRICFSECPFISGRQRLREALAALDAEGENG